jgi:hypothetical protein
MGNSSFTWNAFDFCWFKPFTIISLIRYRKTYTVLFDMQEPNLRYKLVKRIKTLSVIFKCAYVNKSQSNNSFLKVYMARPSKWQELAGPFKTLVFSRILQLCLWNLASIFLENKLTSPCKIPQHILTRSWLKRASWKNLQVPIWRVNCYRKYSDNRITLVT